MGSRWRQENHYRYARMHFDLDSHDSYRATDDDPDLHGPDQQEARLRPGREGPAGTAFGRNRQRRSPAGRVDSPQPGTSVVLTNTMINTITADVYTTHTALEAALTAHQAIRPGCRCPRSTPASRSWTPRPN